MEQDQYCKNDIFDNAYASNQEIKNGIEKKFATPWARPHYIPDHPFQPNHIKLEFRFDLDKIICYGQTTLSLTTKVFEAKTLVLDSKSLNINKVKVNNQEASFTTSENKLTIQLPVPVKQNDKLEVFIDHFVEKPTAGIYFINPDKNYPDRPKQIWTQCQDEDASFFFPCFDHPSFKQTSEAIIHVPKDWFALSNGDLISKEEKDNELIYHYKITIPHSTYLISIVAGNFAQIKNQWDNIPINVYVHPSRIEDGKRSFGNTPKIIQFFSEYIGVRYPYSHYSQVAVAEFIFGGMENTTVTTQTDLTIHDQRAHLDFSSDGLIAHEAAHQWFGDLITCKEWGHAWLNESFATYFDALFHEHNLGKDEFQFKMLQNAETYFTEDSTEYRRSIVTNIYGEPIDVFDSHLYPGGSWRLHMLRNLVGDAQFRQVLKYYLENNQFKNVETIDLQRAFETVTGKNLDWFFDEYIYKAGYPIFKVEFSWQEDTKMLEIKISQTQKEDSMTPIFKMPIDIKIASVNETKLYHIKIEQKEHTFYFYLDNKPKFVRFDPDNWVLKKLEISANPDFLFNQLKADDSIIGRIEAAETLAKKPTLPIIRVLGEQLRSDPFWGVQQKISTQLGKIGGSDALDELLKSLGIQHPKGRRKVVEALGEFRDSKAIDALIKILQTGDPSYYVEASATKALGKTQSSKAFEIIKTQLTKNSHNEVIREHVFAGLQDLKDERGLTLSIEWMQPGKPILARMSAINAVASLGKLFNKDKAFEELMHIFKSTDMFRIKTSLIKAFETLGMPECIGPLQQMQEKESDGRLRRAAYEATQSIQKQLERPKELQELKEELEKLKQQNIEFRSELALLKEQKR